MRLLMCLILFALSVGCSQVPSPMTYPITVQQQMQSAYHWKVFAKEIATGVKREFNKMALMADAPFSAIPVYVQKGDNSSFGQAFEILLKTALMEKDIPVSYDEKSPYRIDWGVKKVVHHACRIERTPGIVEAILIFPLWLAAGDGFVTGPLQHYEVIISTSFSEDGISLMRDSSIFYVNDADARHYADRALPFDSPLDNHLALKTYTVSDH